YDQIDEPPVFRVVYAQTTALLFGSQPLIQHAQRPRQNRHRILAAQIEHQLDQQPGCGAVHLDRDRGDLLHVVHATTSTPLGVATCKYAGDEIQDVGGTDFTVPIIPDHPVFHHVDLFLGVAI